MSQNTSFLTYPDNSIDIHTITPIDIQSNQGYNKVNRRCEMEKLFYSVQSCAEALELSENTIKNLIYDKKLKAYKVGRVWRIAKDDLIDYVTSQSTNLDDEAEEEENKEDTKE